MAVSKLKLSKLNTSIPYGQQVSILIVIQDAKRYNSHYGVCEEGSQNFTECFLLLMERNTQHFLFPQSDQRLGLSQQV